MKLFEDEDLRAAGAVIDVAMTVLSVLFVGLVVLELAAPLSPSQERLVYLVGLLVWGTFAIDYFTRLILAPDRARYVRTNWLSAIALILPAFRIFRGLRALRLLRSVRIARMLTTLARASRVLQRVSSFAGVVYVLSLAVVVQVLAAAGIFSLERGQASSSLDSFWQGLWWAARLTTTLDGVNEPATVEGRVLAMLVVGFGLALSGYITATLAVLILGHRDRSEEALNELRDEIRSLRAELAQSTGGSVSGSPPTNDPQG